MKLLFSTLLLLCSSTLLAQTDKELVQNTVDKNAIEGHIYFLADDLLKGRETGTAENKIAASYLANTMRGYGVQPASKEGTFYQEIPLKKTSPPKSVDLKIDGMLIENKVPIEAVLTQFVGNAIYLGYGLEADYFGKDVKKQLVIIKSGSAEASDARAAFGLRETKMSLAKKAGAAGIIELLSTDENLWGFIEHNFTSSRISLLNAEAEEENKTNSLPYVWVWDKEGAYAAAFSKKSTVKATLMMDAASIETIKTRNVVGMVQGTDPVLKDEYIIYSGHYDHVGIGTPDETGDVIYNGARDNAVGITTVLSMAENLAKYPTKRSALFILFTGEEKGLLGSEYYVENPVLPLSQMVYCFNSDNAGYNDTSLATIIGLNRTSAGPHIKEAAAAFGLTAIDDPAPEQGLFDRSDNVKFAAKGIPAPTFSLGFTAFNGTVTQYYHRPGDEAESLDYDYLLKFFSAYVLSGRKIANDPVTPFWTEGDKYEEAGKKLYKK
ncbi:M28 family peptidase [Altibacter sp.]|uniref:M28 family peptidase n=1 Tax=Altibacter sp. TaxID=2024823 RepID=UPI00258CECC4|nr:M28 family peptidase [Altibacter sp.]MCW9037730.1 M28 family peptidase [Altibacter sp.]